MPCVPLMRSRARSTGRAGHSKPVDITVFRPTMYGHHGPLAVWVSGTVDSTVPPKIAKPAHRVGRARGGRRGESWRSEVTGEAEKPQERPGYHVNAGPPPTGTNSALLGLPAIWLRVNCPCSICRDPRNGERLVSIADLPRDVSVSTVRPAGDRVEIVFGPDGHRATFDVGWLRQFAIGDDGPGGGGRRPGDGGAFNDALSGEDERTEDAKRLWSADAIKPALPQR